ncbi:MAG: hypothetical protein K6G16_07630 [Lachnospiraceae bacterium]|nr:hypothetical protein [Lachnospiraceae bacterium]
MDMRSRNEERRKRRQTGTGLLSGQTNRKKPLRAHDRAAAEGASLCAAVKSVLMRAEKPFARARRGSVTVEASIALPLYLFFFVNILTAFDILRIQDDLTAALHQTGNHIAFHAFDMKYADEAIDYLTGTEAGDATGSVFAEVGTTIYSAFYVKDRVVDYLGSEYLAHSPVEDGEDGISFLRSRIMLQGDEIDLVASYRVQPFFPGLIAFRDYPAEARYFGHAWTGYEPGGAGTSQETEEDPIVYITETGTVYHRNLNCTHLKHAVRSVSVAEALEAENRSGERYTPCEICGGYTNGQGTAYIAEGGDRIHSTVNCPGLKRTIYYVHLSEVDGRPPCSLCGMGN